MRDATQMIREGKSSIDIMRQAFIQGWIGSPKDGGRMFKIQDNTFVKNVHFLRKEGMDINKERRCNKNKTWFVYFMGLPF